MSSKYEEAKGLAKAAAEFFGEVVIVIGSSDDHDAAEAQEICNPDGSSIQGILEAGVGNCVFTKFPFSCLDRDKLKWSISFRGVRFEDLSPVGILKSITPPMHGWYPVIGNPRVFESLGAKKCTCGTKPIVMAVFKDGHIQSQLRCPCCGHEGPVEALEGDAAEAWNESLTK